ncbi:phospholipase/Carboxylesterase [Emticicia oligotrophica DSM 17448]|uniref:Phospholipase/Carboxylesterase n=1 Tax=Emticicia oligotrophica (strain DSM 17448 / CIP 109782 / MTCC 6937 / GPTSA100-15) TaxID=929562 RepID=A0ABM5N529_EMTOG|nr:prolyl oligopeptidase family serine peptidase [Emticicia oligotrophica]AFK04563.1 phospholipase/Carboxylesterase [Emticicia oligotrophica DSM 17448]
MKNKLLLLIIFSAFVNIGVFAKTSNFIASNQYTLVVEGYDWGPAVSKVILELDAPTTNADFKDYTVSVDRSSDCVTIPENQKNGSRTVVFAYVSDPQGNRVKEGSNITLVLSVAPNLPIGSPFQYSTGGKCRGNQWVTYQVTVTDTKTNKVWNKEKSRIRPLVDDFDLTGKYEYEAGKTMSYAAFTPKKKASKAPLIIWLHGGGEGGYDPTITLLGNKAANYASPEIQAYFGGAYVLSPQCPGAWMHDKDGKTQPGSGEDVYNIGLMALIKEFVNKHPDIDTKRIYLGGCSNGGYMSLKLLLKEPNYFAAAYISALAYQSQYITDQQINSIKHIPIWFLHSKEDNTTKPDLTVVPVYERLKKAGAKNLHFSYYDHVTDITGFFGGENYYYNGHWSWIYSHANTAKLDYDGKPVLLNGRPVTIMEWMAAQAKK